MAQPKVLLGEASHPAAPFQVEWHAIWGVLGILGFVFVLVGGIDAALVWYPMSFGRPEWEFGSVTAGMNGLPLPVLGLGLMLGQALAEGHRWVARGVIVVLALLAAAIVALGVIYATDAPLALQAASGNAMATQGVEKSMVKTVIQLAAYPIGLAVVSWRSWGMTRREG